MTSEELLKRFEPLVAETFEYERQIWQARFSPCGRFLLAAGYDATIQRWRVAEAIAAETLEAAKKPVAKKAGKPEVPSSFEAISPLSGHDGWLQCLAFLPSGDRVIAADSWGRVSCWDYSSETVDAPVWTKPDALAGWVRAIAVSPDGTLVAAGGNDSVVRVFSTNDGSLVRELTGVPEVVFSLSFSPDGRTLVAGDFKAVLREWNVESGEKQRELTVEGFYRLNHMQESGGIRQVAFSPDGQKLIAGGMKDPEGGFAKGAPALALYDWASGERVQELVAGDTQDGFIYDVWFHNEGFVVATSSAFPGKGKLIFWQPGDEQPFFSSSKLANGRSVSLHPDGRRLLFASSNSANANGRPLKDGEYLGGAGRLQLLVVSG
jgi:WD40 repeat protein